MGAGALTQSPDYSYLALPVAIVSGTLFVVLGIMYLISNRREIRALARYVEPSHIIVLGLLIAAAGVIWQYTRAAPLDPKIAELTSQIAQLQSAAKSAQQPHASVQTSATVTAVKHKAPFYSRADIERLLEASFEITTLLQQKAVPAREAAQAFIRSWHDLLLQKGEPAFRAALKAVRLQVEDVNNSAWAISNKYQHYNSEIGPILGGASFAERFFGASNRFAEAAQNLPQQIDVRTLTFMTPTRDEYEQHVGTFQQWISDTYDRNKLATERFRSMEHAEVQSSKENGGVK